MKISDYISLFTAILSLFAIIISIITVHYSIKFNKEQLEHNKNSVRPIGRFIFGDYENELYVNVENAGTGPLIIKDIWFKKDNIYEESIMSLMPEVPDIWTDFTEELIDKVIPSQSSICLFKISPQYDETILKLRESLKGISGHIEYTDIYNQSFQYDRDFSWFGRTLKL